MDALTEGTTRGRLAPIKAQSNEKLALVVARADCRWGDRDGSMPTFVRLMQEWHVRACTWNFSLPSHKETNKHSLYT